MFYSRFCGSQRTANVAEQYRPYESLLPEDRARVAMAASQFLLRNDYVSLQEAAEQRGTEIHQLWREIIVGAGLPGCELPAFWFTT
jgi:hypothetical protein